MDLDLLKKENRDNFISENMGFVKSVAYNICKRPLSSENDDELSIALIAFNKACDTYNNIKVNFHSYASTIIRNALIDFFRKSNKNIVLSFSVEEDNFDYIDNTLSINKYNQSKEKELLSEEISYFVKELTKYNLKFSDLVEASPSHKDTRDNLLNIATTCTRNPYITDYIKSKKTLPIKEICLLTSCNRKLIEKWRKYIIALILILDNGEYLYLKSYLNIKKVGDVDD